MKLPPICRVRDKSKLISWDEMMSIYSTNSAVMNDLYSFSLEVWISNPENIDSDEELNALCYHLGIKIAEVTKIRSLYACQISEEFCDESEEWQILINLHFLNTSDMEDVRSALATIKLGQ